MAQTPLEYSICIQLFDVLDENEDSAIQLEEWLDGVDARIMARLHEHASAETWRRLAFGQEPWAER